MQRVIGECRGFFENLPVQEKEKIEMKNEKSFLGWSRVSFFFVLLLSTFFSSSLLLCLLFCLLWFDVGDWVSKLR